MVPAGHGQRREIGGVAVALDDLRGHFIHIEAEQAAHDGFHFRRKHGVRPHGPGEFAHAHVVEGGGETGTVALEFGVEAAILSEKLVGSAWMPWVRPMQSSP